MQSLLFTPASERQLRVGGYLLIAAVVASFLFSLILPMVASAMPDSAGMLHLAAHVAEIMLVVYVLLLVLNVLNFHFDYYDANVLVFLLLGLLVAQNAVAIFQIFADSTGGFAKMLHWADVALGVLVGCSQAALAIWVYRAVEDLQGYLRPLCVISITAAGMLIISPLISVSEGISFYMGMFCAGLLMASKILLAIVFFYLARTSPRAMPEV